MTIQPDLKTIYLFRHGSYSFSTGELNENGYRQLVISAESIKPDLVSLTELPIFHSPQKRARQSAEVLAEQLRSDTRKTTLSQQLGLDCDSDGIAKVISSLTTPTLLVSHAPDLEHFLKCRGISHQFMTGSFYKLQF